MVWALQVSSKKQALVHLAKAAGGYLMLSCLLMLGCTDDDSTLLLPTQGSPDVRERTGSSDRTLFATRPENRSGLDAGSSSLDAGSGCAMGELRCAENLLFVCSSEGDWTTVEACASSSLCEDSVTLCRVSPESCEGKVPACLSPVCEKFEQRCSGPISEVCNEGRTGFELLHNCGKVCEGSVCDPDLGCRAQFCEPGEYQCLSGVNAPPTFCNDTCAAFDLVVETDSELLASYCDGHNSSN